MIDALARSMLSRRAMASTENQRWLRRAIELACESVAEGGGPFGAVVVRGGREIAIGKNRVTLANDPTAHAEIVAVREACRALASFSLEGCEIFASCEPCPMCLAALHWARVDRIAFAATRADAQAAGFDDERLYREIARPLELRELPTQRFGVEDCGAAFDAWRARADRVPY